MPALACFYRKRRLISGTCEQFTTRWQHKAASCQHFLRASTVERVDTVARDLCTDRTATGKRWRPHRQLTYLCISHNWHIVLTLIRQNDQTITHSTGSLEFDAQRQALYASAHWATPICIFTIFGHAVTLTFDLLTSKLTSSSMSQDALATKVWRKSINAYQRYCGNKPWKWYFSHIWSHCDHFDAIGSSLS